MRGEGCRYLAMANPSCLPTVSYPSVVLAGVFHAVSRVTETAAVPSRATQFLLILSHALASYWAPDSIAVPVNRKGPVISLLAAAKKAARLVCADSESTSAGGT